MTVLIALPHITKTIVQQQDLIVKQDLLVKQDQEKK